MAILFCDGMCALSRYVFVIVLFYQMTEKGVGRCRKV